MGDKGPWTEGGDYARTGRQSAKCVGKKKVFGCYLFQRVKLGLLSIGILVYGVDDSSRCRLG